MNSQHLIAEWKQLSLIDLRWKERQQLLLRHMQRGDVRRALSMFVNSPPCVQFTLFDGITESGAACFAFDLSLRRRKRLWACLIGGAENSDSELFSWLLSLPQVEHDFLRASAHQNLTDAELRYALAIVSTFVELNTGSFASGVALPEGNQLPRHDVSIGMNEPGRLWAMRFPVCHLLWHSVTQDLDAARFRSDLLQPVRGLSWVRVNHFCNQWSQVAPKTPIIPKGWTSETTDAGLRAKLASVSMNLSSDGYRLPTEVEWEQMVHQHQSTLAQEPLDPNLIAEDWLFSDVNGQSTEALSVGQNVEGSLVDIDAVGLEWVLDSEHHHHSLRGANNWCSEPYPSRVYKGRALGRAKWSGQSHRSRTLSLSDISDRKFAHALDPPRSIGFRVIWWESKKEQKPNCV